MTNGKISYLVIHKDKGVQTEIDITMESEQDDAPAKELVFAPKAIVDRQLAEPPHSPDWIVHER